MPAHRAARRPRGGATPRRRRRAPPGAAPVHAVDTATERELMLARRSAAAAFAPAAAKSATRFGPEVDEVPEHLVGDETVPGGQHDQLSCDCVALRGRPARWNVFMNAPFRAKASGCGIVEEAAMASAYRRCFDARRRPCRVTGPRSSPAARSRRVVRTQRANSARSAAATVSAA